MTARAYDFTTDWTSEIQGEMAHALAHLVGKPGVRILEVGSYEGRSTCWFLDNVLTGAGSEIVCIEPWATYDDRPGDDWDAIRDRFWNNVDRRDVRRFADWCDADDTTEGTHGFFDAAFIDGDHAAHAVLNDAVRAFDYLKPGGVLMFDDYSWERASDPENVPRTAINAFIACYKAKLQPTGIAGSKFVAVTKK